MSGEGARASGREREPDPSGEREQAMGREGEFGESGTRLSVRVHDRPHALERVIGLIRRRALPVRRFSVAESDGETIELLLRLDPGAAVGRVCAALRELYDVADVAVVAAPAEAMRELALVRVRSDAAELAGGYGRRIAVDGDEVVLEITGAPDEVERALTGLRDRQLMTGFVRSGEIAVPGGRTDTMGS